MATRKTLVFFLIISVVAAATLAAPGGGSGGMHNGTATTGDQQQGADAAQPPSSESGSDSHDEQTAESPETAIDDATEEEPTEEEGNSLSFPVIWSENVTIPLRGVYALPTLEGAYVNVNGTYWYLQGDAQNAWQAQSAAPEGMTDVSWVDWGDNLEAKSWTDNSVVRVETVLYKDLTEPMNGYEMFHVSGQGTDEVWGSNGIMYSAPQATVYSACARLVIQKLEKERDAQDLELTWDTPTTQWVGDAQAPLLNSGVWETTEGHTESYSAEINVQGKVIYGYNWFVKNIDDAPGDYRITFVLDDTCPAGRNTAFDTTQVFSTQEEGEEETNETTSAPETGGGIATIDTAHDLSYIDVRITSGSGSSGGGHDGGSGGGHGGGSGSSGGHSGNETPGSGHNHDDDYLPAIESLEERSVQDTSGYSIYLAQGWNSIRLPWFVLTGTAQVPGLDVAQYDVTTVLSSIEGRYAYLAYHDGDAWQTYLPNDPAATTFSAFPTGATAKDHVYHIYMTQGGRLEIGAREP